MYAQSQSEQHKWPGVEAYTNPVVMSARSWLLRYALILVRRAQASNTHRQHLSGDAPSNLKNDTHNWELF